MIDNIVNSINNSNNDSDTISDYIGNSYNINEDNIVKIIYI